MLPWIRENPKTASGFELWLVTGDNGLAADPPVNAPFTISTAARTEVMVEGP